MVEPSTSVALATQALKTAKQFWERLKPTYQKKVLIKLEKLFSDFGMYLHLTQERASTVQLISSRSVKTKIDDIYVPPKFTTNVQGDTLVSDNDLISDIRDGKRVVVRGNGGSGKTLFLKRLWLDVFNEPKGKIPVMIELRKFNQFSNLDLITLIRNTLSTEKTISEELFHELAKDGAFFMVFDGFDEIAVENRDKIEAQILDFERQYKGCNVVVSSRPNENFISWQVFHTYDVAPLNREQTLELINKVPVDEGIRSDFIKLITREFYSKYEDFLSSPLLTLMMLVTFRRKGDISDISDNIVEFYDNAFHALYSEHDAIKEQYKRPHHLKINDFRLVFSTFCI
ncbi:MAG TPA: NACHT domain-containing protein, partial [Hellea balneolensis]|nr:NACHT domain-containing protein [Hellea balneolensis]